MCFKDCIKKTLKSGSNLQEEDAPLPNKWVFSKLLSNAILFHQSQFVYFQSEAMKAKKSSQLA